ncbi:hypothetical protein D3C77_768230 [compost metagenome]
MQGRGVGRPATDDLDGRLEVVQGGSDARDQAAAADGDEYCIQFWKLFKQLHADGALAGNNVGIVVR